MSERAKRGASSFLKLESMAVAAPCVEEQEAEPEKSGMGFCFSKVAFWFDRADALAFVLDLYLVCKRSRNC